MRDINRIEPFCQEIAELWKKQPDMRFTQFMMNILGELSQDGDPWFLEEDNALDKIKNISWLQ